MFMENLGVILALAGAVLSVLLAGYGSARGVGMAGEAAAGVISENPELYGKVLPLQVLPGSQGIYGLLVCFLVLLKTPVLGGETLSIVQGAQMLVACLPIAVVGLASAILQARVACSAIYMLAKRPEAGGKGIVMTVMVETYAIFALLASALMVSGI